MPLVVDRHFFVYGRYILELKWIEGYEGLYKISRDGQVYSFAKPNKIKKLKICKSPAGYYHLGLRKHGIMKHHRVNRLVGIAYIPNPNNLPLINHINGIKDDNRVENLEWVSPKGNHIHAVSIGSYDNCFKLNRKKAREIREIFEHGIKTRDIALLYGVKSSTVNAVVNNKRWAI